MWLAHHVMHKVTGLKYRMILTPDSYSFINLVDLRQIKYGLSTLIDRMDQDWYVADNHSLMTLKRDKLFTAVFPTGICAGSRARLYMLRLGSECSICCLNHSNQLFYTPFLWWIERGGSGIPIFSVKLKNTLSDRIFKQSEIPGSHIIGLVDNLSSHLEKQPE